MAVCADQSDDVSCTPLKRQKRSPASFEPITTPGMPSVSPTPASPTPTGPMRVASSRVSSSGKRRRRAAPDGDGRGPEELQAPVPHVQ
eukprot:1070332-Pyramimonas_sp.AAC.1